MGEEWDRSCSAREARTIDDGARRPVGEKKTHVLPPLSESTSLNVGSLQLM